MEEKKNFSQRWQKVDMLYIWLLSQCQKRSASFYSKTVWHLYPMLIRFVRSYFLVYFLIIAGRSCSTGFSRVSLLKYCFMVTAGIQHLTFVAKSGGRVLAPVSRFTRNGFQLEYLCWMAMKLKIYLKFIITPIQQWQVYTILTAKKPANYSFE